MKKVLSVLLCVVLTLTALPLGAFNLTVSGYYVDPEDEIIPSPTGEGYENGFSYRYDRTTWTAVITSADSSVSGDVVFPQTVGGFTVTKIDEEFGSTNITSLTIPSGIGMGYFAFDSCVGLTSVTVLGGNIGEYVFSNCNSLKSVILGYGVTSIDNFAFYDCSSLEIIEMPNSLTSIGDYAFEWCSSLSDVWYHGSCEDKDNITIGDYNTNLVDATWHYNVCDTHIYSADCDTTCNKCDWERTTTTDHVYTDSDDVYCNICEEIKETLFVDGYYFDVVNNKATITGVDSSIRGDITVPSTLAGCPVVAIGDSAFSHSWIESLVIPDSVTSIGCWAFNDCSSLQDIVIGDSVTRIGSHAFYDCSSLKNITIPENLTSIGESAFISSFTIKNVYITNLEAWCYIDFEDTYSNPIYYAENLCLNNQVLKNIVIPEGTKKINTSVFEGYSSLESIIIPGSVSIIDDCAFAICEKLKTVVIHEGVTRIGWQTFNDCSSLESITLPKSVTEIDDYAFSDCDALKYVFYAGTEQEKVNIAIGSVNNSKIKYALWHYNTCESEHNYFGECDSTCNNCEWTRTATEEHSYNSDYDTNCNVCGYIRTVVTNEEFIVTAQGGTAARGGTITVPIVVEKNVGWCALDIRVSYDADVLEIQCPNHEDGKNCIGIRKPSVVKKEDFAMAEAYASDNVAVYPPKHSTQPYSLGWAYATIQEDITETGTYATIVFKVKDDAAFGETKVDIEVQTITNCDLEHPTALVNDATINIVDKYVNTNIPCDPNLEKATATSVALVAAQGYEYSMDGTTWQTSNVFNNLAPNTEYTFYQRIAETDTHFASAVSKKLVVKTIKHNAADPVAPVEKSKIATSVTLVAVEGYEYSMNGETWQTSNVFENLAPNTEYTFYQRVAETDTHYASVVSAPLVVKTSKYNNVAFPIAPVEKSKTATSVTLVAVEGYEYSMDGETWQTSNVFENLAPNTEYTFYQRVAETGTHYASAVSKKLVVKTIKHNAADPVAPVEKSKIATSVTLVAVEGYEYSMNGETWQTSNVFENLAPNTEYTFYQRVAETDTHYASVVSAPLVVKTIKHTASTPISPVIASKEATVIVLAAQQGYEYSIDGETWQTSNVFENLTPGTTYTFYQRVAETDTHYASETSVGTTCTTLKLQQTAPVAPVVLRVEATTVTLLAKEGYEYSLDGETWQTSNVFENLAPNTEYNFYQRKAEIDTHYASVPSAPLVVKTIKHTAETPVAPETLEITATTVTLVAMDGYEYSLDGETWQTSNVFENLAPNTEYTFYQRSAETDTHYASAVSEKLVVKTIKHNTAAPVTPVVKSKTAISVTLVAMDGYEYSLNGETWQTSNVFENLAPNTEYTFYQRIAETDTHYASTVSEKLAVKTIKHNAAAPVTPVEESKTATSVTLVAVEGYEYSMDGENWQTSNVFENLAPNTEYIFYQRKAETDTHYASSPSAPLVVKTIKHTAATPIAPETLEITATTVTLVAMEGYEYSLDGENWQTSNVFENLAPNTEYTFYQRKAETNTHYASEISAELVVKTIKHTAATPIVLETSEITATTITLVATEGYEYSLDGETWQDSNVFENLAPNTEYTFYQRIAETNTHYASAISEKLVVKTIKHNAATPVAPVEESKTATTVTLVAVEGYEYSLDGENWQSSNAFENLAPNTEYTLYQRKAETDTHYASEISTALVVTTKKHTEAAPFQPIIASKDATVVVLVVQTGYEYSLDGENWQSSNVFDNLKPGTTYVFYQRVAETNTHYASVASIGTTCVTLKLQQTAPVAPILSETGATTITLLKKQGYEYSLDGETWQSSNVFENLAPNTEYTLYQRKTETDTHYASSPSAPLVVKTIKHTAETPVAPETLEITATTITLVAVEGYEYSMDGETWQDSNVFENLVPNTEYTFYQRIAETNTHYASAISEKLVVKTIKHNAATPVAPVEESKTATTVTLVAVEGYEYSLDGENWQSSNVFENFAPNTEYTFYQRKAETDTHYASEISAKLVVNTYISGNVNNDDAVTLDDVVLLAQYVAGWNVELNLNVADVNGDGNETLDDVVLLAQFVAGWDVTIN